MTHKHVWIAYSTALVDRCVMLQCVECGAMGTVDNPTKKEWSEAFYAPSRPYRWNDEGRVRIRHNAPCPCYVVAAPKDALNCSCRSQGGKRAYERGPAELIGPERPITLDDLADLLALADVVRDSDLCSRVFPLFIRAFQDDTGREPSRAARRIASRTEKWDRMGLHFSPHVVAMALRTCAERSVRV